MKKFLLVNYTQPTTYANEIPYLWLTLKSYFQKHSKDSSAWQWLDPIHNAVSDSVEILIDEIVSCQPDVLAISCYMWNDKLTMYVAEHVKNKLPNIEIIAGGPALYYEYDKGWFSKNSFIDLVCEYAAYGEVFITDYLDGKQFKDIPYAIYPTLGKTYWNKSVAPFDRRTFEYALPYLDNADYLSTYPKNKVKVILDTSRGCPYACSFCEWGGGTSTKVVFKTLEETLRELDFIFETLQPHYIDIINANFGIKIDDIIVAERICELNQKYKCVKQVNIYGPTKTNKKNLKEIFRLFVSNGIIDDLKVSIQSISDIALNNIERVDMSYDKQIELYNDLCVEFKVPLKIETMMGLPGETIESFYTMVGELTKSELLYPMMHEWMMLPSAPAAHPDYIKKFEIKTKTVKYNKDDYDTNFMKRKDYGVIKERVGNRNILDDQRWLAPYHIVVSTYSYTIEDWIEMELFKYYFTFLSATTILTPFHKYLRQQNIDLAEFHRSLFNDCLMSIPILNKCYTDFIKNIKSDEPSDIWYTDLGENLPYFSHMSTLKFLILLNPKGFFNNLETWMISKYGEDPIIRDICEHLRDNIKTPMLGSDSPQDKIRACIAMCGHWSGQLFFDDYVSKY